MVIVVNHIISSAILYFQNPRRFHCQENAPDLAWQDDRLKQLSIHSEVPVSSGTHLQLFQDACLKFLEVGTVDELRSTIKDVLHLLFPDPLVCIVYLTDPGSGELYTEDGLRLSQFLPHQGICWEAINSRQGIIQTSIDPRDPVITAIKCHCDNTSTVPVSPVLSFPVVDITGDKVIALIVTSGGSTCIKDLDKLQPIGKQIVACFRRLCRTHSPVRQTSVNTEALVKLCGELYDHDASVLQLKVIKYLEEQTSAESSFLLLVVPDTQELFCQVVGDRVLAEELRFPGHNSSFATALETQQPIRLEDIPLDKRKGIEEFLEKKLQSFLCVPVTSRNSDSLIALVCVANKIGGDKFTEDDIFSIHQCFRYTAAVLTSTLAFQNERKLKIQTQAMLQVARNLFTRLDDLTKLLREVMQEARNLTHAERCSVFLIDNETEELVAKVFDGIPAEDNMIETEIRLPITQGIAGHVATTGQLLNIRDAYSHPMFYRGMDDSTGFRTRNILCFPLKDENGVVLGVAQLCNKKNGPCFTIFDEELALAFAVYCCISISHSMMYEKMVESQFRNNLANELMMYHMKVCNEDVELLTKTEVTPTQVYDAEFAKFTYAPRSLPENDSLNASLSMFEDLGFISKYRIKLDTLARFLLMVKKGYRNPPYHNWMHAYTVSHFCFLLTKNLKLENYLEDIEIFALFVSCLCHDIDHRGTNNSFQVASKSVLAALYSSEGSVMERHHFAQTMCIVNTEGCNIFENLTSKDYQNVLDLIRDIILATDLAHHLRILKNIKEMAKAGYKKSVVRYRKLLLCLLMTSCDLSDQTKDWNNIKNIAGLIYQEFFSQGDVEKELGVEPIEMMDRERAQIPDLQISFLDHIATPLFSVLAEIFPEAKQVSDTVEDNRKHWLKVKELLLLRSHGSTSKMTLDEVLSVDEEISPEVFKNAPIQNGQ
ncbi:hypothetical protein ScPMuIL_010900 [Solemya velum]